MTAPTRTSMPWEERVSIAMTAGLEKILQFLARLTWRHRTKLLLLAAALAAVLFLSTWLTITVFAAVFVGTLATLLIRHSGVASPPKGTQRITEPVEIGQTVEGSKPVALDLFHRHMLIGGQTGFGKTNLLDLIIDPAVNDPHCRVFLIDVAKRGAGLGKWEPHVEQLAATRDEAVTLLATLKQNQDAIWDRLRTQGRWETSRTDPSILLVIDELTPLIAGKDGKKVSAQLWELLHVGRAAGLNAVAAMVKPHSGVIDTNVRDLFNHRAAFRVATPEMGTTIIGYPINLPPRDYPVGTALLVADDGEPTRIKTHKADPSCLTPRASDTSGSGRRGWGWRS